MIAAPQSVTAVRRSAILGGHRPPLQRTIVGGQRAPLRRAFTLIELMVVIAVMVFLTGGIALVLSGRGGDGAALKTAQSLLSGLVGTARAQAVLHQTTARLVVYAQMPPGANVDAAKYLRMLQVVRQETFANGSTAWVAVGDPVLLPLPICVVPPAPVPPDHLGLPAGQNWNNNVAMGPVSTLTAENGFRYRGQGASTATQFFGLANQTGRVLYLEFESDGTVVAPRGLPAGTPVKIALATAVLSSNATPRFNNRDTVRGVVVRRTGAVSLVHRADAF